MDVDQAARAASENAGGAPAARAADPAARAADASSARFGGAIREPPPAHAVSSSSYSYSEESEEGAERVAPATAARAAGPRSNARGVAAKSEPPRRRDTAPRRELRDEGGNSSIPARVARRELRDGGGSSSVPARVRALAEDAMRRRAAPQRGRGSPQQRRRLPQRDATPSPRREQPSRRQLHTPRGEPLRREQSPPPSRRGERERRHLPSRSRSAIPLRAGPRGSSLNVATRMRMHAAYLQEEAARYMQAANALTDSRAIAAGAASSAAPRAVGIGPHAVSAKAIPGVASKARGAPPRAPESFTSVARAASPVSASEAPSSVRRSVLNPAPGVYPEGMWRAGLVVGSGAWRRQRYRVQKYEAESAASGCDASGAGGSAGASGSGY